MVGLVVQEAYIQGQNDPAYEAIIKSISSIMFLSTPHRDTNLAETLNRILTVSFVAYPIQSIAELSTGSQTLQRPNEQFSACCAKLTNRVVLRDTAYADGQNKCSKFRNDF